MNNRYEDSLEYFVIDVLHCSLDDLKLLEQVYSPLAEMCHVDVTHSLTDLNEMMKLTYGAISYTIGELIENIASGDEIEVVDKEGYGWVTYKIEGNLKKDLLKVAKHLQESNPDISNLRKPKFNNILDDLEYTIDFDETPETNRDYVIQYIFDNDIVRSEGYEVK